MRIAAYLLASSALALTACTSAMHIQGPNSEPLVMVDCGASTSMAVCYSRAAKECPSGYKTVSEDSGINRKSLKVACK